MPLWLGIPCGDAEPLGENLHAHPFDAATGRASLEDKAREIQLVEGAETRLNHGLHGWSVIVLTRNCDEPGTMRIANQPHGFARRAQSSFHFRAYWYPFDVAAQYIGQEMILFMSAIEADFITKKTPADTQTD